MIAGHAYTLAEPRRDGRHDLGRRGEDAAAAALRRAGLVIVERRFRNRLGEIDLIARRDDLVMFVEVKTRRGSGFGVAEAVTPSKRRRMARVALGYLTLRRWHQRPCRFDVVEVTEQPDGTLSTRHIDDAFRLWPTG